MVGLTEYTRIRFNISVWKKMYTKAKIWEDTLQRLWICYESREQKRSACRGVRI